MASVKQQLVSILPRVTGSLSVIGNATIICDVRRLFRKKSPLDTPGTYHRLMLGMSLTNMSGAIGTGLSTWPMPRGSAFQAFGNEGTCRVQAFLIQIAIAAPFYNLCLAIYYFLVIVKNTPSKKVRFVEKFMHPICLVFGVGTAIAGLGLDIFGPASFWCWIEQGNEGQNEIFRWIFWHGPLWAIIATVSVIMATIYSNLRKQDRTQIRWSFLMRSGSFMIGRQSIEGTGRQSIDGSGRQSMEGTGRQSIDGSGRQSIEGTADAPDQQPNQPTNDNLPRQSTLPTYMASSRRPSRSMPSSRRSDMAIPSATSAFSTSDSFKWQSMWYLGSFYLNWMFLTAVRGVQAASKPVPFWLVLLAVTFTPFLGFLNAIVYFRPKYMRQRRLNPEVGRLVTIFKVAFPYDKLCGFSYAPCRSVWSYCTRERNNESPSSDTEEPITERNGAEGHRDVALSSEVNQDVELP